MNRVFDRLWRERAATAAALKADYEKRLAAWEEKRLAWNRRHGLVSEGAVMPAPRDIDVPTERRIRFLSTFSSQLKRTPTDSNAGESIAEFRSLLDRHIQVEPSDDLSALATMCDEWCLGHPETDLLPLVEDLVTHARALKAAVDASGGPAHAGTRRRLIRELVEELDGLAASLQKRIERRRAAAEPPAPPDGAAEEARGAAREASEAEAKTARVKEALAWWRTEGVHHDDPEWVREYVRIHRERILGAEPEIRRAFEADGDMCSTHEKCLGLAEWAAASIPQEIAFHLPDSETPLRIDRVGIGGRPDSLVGRLAYILRKHFGYKREVLLPAALAPIAPTPVHLTPLEEILDELPRSVRGEIARDIKAAVSRDEVAGICRRVVALRKEQLEAEGVPEEEQRQRLMTLEVNLRRAAERPMRREGMV